MKTTTECFLIDDDIDDQEIFSMALKEVDENIRFVAANNGIEALEKLREDRSFIPDYIFIDVNMPKMNGVQCLAAIKKLENLQGVKIFMFSTSADDKIIHTSKELGANDFLIKPSGYHLLIETLAKIFEK